MPIFRSEGVQNKVRRSRLKRASTQAAYTVNGRVKRERSIRWGVKTTSFSVINFTNGGSLLSSINRFAKKFPKRKINVLDWGCGEGVAAKELAENSRLNVFGYAKDAYPALLFPKNVTFLNTTPRVLIRYLKVHKIKLDIIYSHMALKYLPREAFMKHVCELAECTRVGGRIFTGLFLTSMHGINDEVFLVFKQNGLRPTFVDGQMIYLTKVK